MYLLSLVWHIYRVDTAYRNTVDSQQVQEVSRSELFGIFATLVFPFTFNWIPFMFDMYGLSGLWCWIKRTQHGCNEDQSLGLKLMFSLFYGLLLLLMLFSVISLLVILIALCKRWVGLMGLQRRQYLRGIKEMAVVVVYPILYNVICILLVANRIDSSIRISRGEKPFYPLWLAHALADSFRTLLPPLAFLLHPSSWKNLICPRKKRGPDTSGYYYVPPEDSDIKEGILIEGCQQVNYNSILQEN